MKTIIVGAGPSGLFAAKELADDFDVTVLERRDYVGGSGLHSDGKLNFHPLIGGDLTKFLSEKEAWDLVSYIREVFLSLGVEEREQDEAGMEDLKARAAKAGIRFIKIKQNHIGSDYLPEVMARMRRTLEEKGVDFLLGVEATDLMVEGDRVTGVKTDDGLQSADNVILVPGRSGSRWLSSLMGRLGVQMHFNPIDISLRVEVPHEVVQEIINGYGVWDPKFHIYTPSYDDFVRTFCVCPRGFVVEDAYEDGLIGVNGQSMRETGSPNTNFALLTKMKLTHPLENTAEYGRRIAQLANTLGGKRPILQRLGDLRANRRSTWDRIERSYVEPTLENTTPGDISMAYPSRIIRDFLEGLQMLDKVIPGVNSASTLLYAPEIKFYAMRIETDRHLRTTISNLYVAGDGSGVSRGIIGAAATGIIAAKGIINRDCPNLHLLLKSS
ncbi:MAG: NAD(P)-binding protein [Candidatus Bathyarchaeota archaeon]